MGKFSKLSKSVCPLHVAFGLSACIIVNDLCGNLISQFAETCVVSLAVAWIIGRSIWGASGEHKSKKTGDEPQCKCGDNGCGKKTLNG